MDLQEKVKILNDEQILKLSKYCEKMTYQAEELLIHKEHIPQIAIVLLSGKVSCEVNRIPLNYKKNSLIGLYELNKGAPMDYNVKIYPGATIMIISMSLLQLLKQTNSELISSLLYKFSIS